MRLRALSMVSISITPVTRNAARGIRQHVLEDEELQRVDRFIERRERGGDGERRGEQGDQREQRGVSEAARGLQAALLVEAACDGVKEIDRGAPPILLHYPFIIARWRTSSSCTTASAARYGAWPSSSPRASSASPAPRRACAPCRESRRTLPMGMPRSRNPD